MTSIIKGALTIALAIGCIVGLGSCTKYNVIETGIANGNHQTSMDAYFSTDAYNWELTQQLIRHAGVESYFTATSGSAQGITFLGLTNFSILRYLLQLQERENYAAMDEGRSPKEITIADIPQEDARRMVLNCLIPRRLMLSDIPVGRPSSDSDVIIGTGGMEVTTLGGTKLWIYTFREAYDNIPNSGPFSIYVVSEATSKRVKIASSDIQTLSGVVHSLPYSFTLGEF